MSGGIPSLALKDEDVTKFLASSTHLGTNNLDFQMEQYVFKRRSDGESSPKPKKQFVDCRRSTAAQFFAEETDQESVCPEMIVQLINDANESNDENIVLKNLKIIQDIIVDKVPKLLDNFLDEVVSFQQNIKKNVRVFVVKFIESVCKQMPQFFPKLVGNLDLMLQDPSVVVQKTVIKTAIILYPISIRWICEAKHIDDVMVATWSLINELKFKVCALLDSDNDGLRVMSLKFMQCIVIIQTAKDEYYKHGLSLDDIPFVMKIFKPRKLEEEAKDVFQKIVNFQGTSHISGFNLMTCMQVLTTVARKRYSFFSKVLQAFESLHANLPPTLGQSQVSSVRKFLKLQLFTLAKHPQSKDFRSLISIMLSDLGATAQQINKYFPGKDKLSLKKSQTSQSAIKQTVFKNSTDEKLASKEDCVVSSCKATAIDITAEDIFPKLTNINVSDLVLVSMLSLPDDMPSHFQSSYTPIAAAGTEPQVRHLARLIASQLNVAGLGKGVECTVHEQENMDASDEEEGTETRQIETVLNLTTAKKEQKKQPLLLIPSGNFQPKVGKLSKDIDFQIPTAPFSLEESEKLCKSAYRRILDAEKAITKKGASPIRVKILTALATQFGGIFDSELKSYILESPRNRLELAFSWLYQEYSFYKGFEGPSESDAEKYEKIVNYLLKSLLENDEQNSNLCRFFLDLPNVTEGMAECLKVLIGNEDMTDQALEIAKNMSLDRPPQKLLFLSVMCDLTLHDKTNVRSKAIDAVVGLYENGYMNSFIEAFALRSLKFLLDNEPQSSSLIIFQTLPETWSDELIRVCLNLSFALLPYNHSLINDIGEIYVKTSADVKRTILRGLEAPVKHITMTSPELLSFVENCPPGAETLVTRIIHILTDKALPSIELVARVRDLYQKRVPDVRFLIPIINGLTKREVISALPELIKLNPTVVKEVFHRLVGSNFTSPLSPAELMVALHNIDTSQCSLKVIIKATSLCFEEKHIFTQVVLAMVMQQLMEQNPLPVLLMRTVIQSLLNHPHLLGFVTNVLQRLILKEVWKYPKIWEGFIKCCQRTKPQSFQVLLQLPPPQLKEVITTYADLCDPLVEHVNSFTENQKSHISEGVLKVLEAIPGKSDASKVVDNSEIPGEPLPPGEESA